MKKRVLSFENSAGVLFVVLLVAFSATAIHLAFFIDIDFWDSHNFLLQSLRLSDDQFSFIGFDSQRPRTWVVILTVINVISKSISGSYPSLHIYKLVMVFFAFASVIVWTVVLSKIWNRLVAYVAMIFFISQQMFLHYAPFLLTDILACFFWGVLFWVFQNTLDTFGKKNEKSRRFCLAVLLGIIGTLVGHTKNHFSLLLPSLLVLFFISYCFLPSFRKVRWGSKREVYFWLGVTLFSYILSMELIMRAFGDPNFGLWTHFQLLILQAKDQVKWETPAEMYIENLWIIFGPLFWVLSALSVGLWIKFKSKTKLRSPRARMGTLCLGGTIAVYLLLTQFIHHREVRYLIPLLPGLMGFIAFIAVSSADHLKKNMKVAWASAWALALLFPLGRTVADVKVYYEDRIYRESTANTTGFWNYLQSPSLRGKSCKNIIACRFFLRTLSSSELNQDPYYRHYDYFPQLIYNTAKPSLSLSCPLTHNYYDIVIPLMKNTPSPEDACYQILEFPEPPNQTPLVVVLKPLGQQLETTEVERLKASLLPSSKEKITCKKVLSDKHLCFEYRKFFGK